MLNFSLIVQAFINGCDGKILYTSDGGQTWSAQKSGTSNGGHSYIDSNKNDQDIFNISCYPNPFTESTNISFTLAEESNVSIDIIDINGKVADRLLDGVKYRTGLHTVKWDVNESRNLSLKPRIYFYSILIQEDVNLYSKSGTLVKR